MSVERSQSYEPDKVNYHLWLVREFPVALVGRHRPVRDPNVVPWILGLLADIKEKGCFLNPILLWNHHHHDLLLPYAVRHGGNRLWCADQLGWTHVPATVSSHPTDKEVTETLRDMGGVRVRPHDLQQYFPDGGTVWANAYGYGLYDVKRPEVTYGSTS